MENGKIAAESAQTLPVGLVKGFVSRVNSLLNRSLFASSLGMQFGGNRDLYASFGWDRTITSQAIWEMYQRGGIARIDVVRRL